MVGYDPSNSYNTSSPTGLPGSSANSTLGYPGLTAADAGLTLPAEAGQTIKTIGQSVAAFMALDQTSQSNLAEMLWQAGFFSKTVYRSKAITPADIEMAMGQALLAAAHVGQPLSQVLAEHIQSFGASGGAGQFPGASLRTLGLGKYPLMFTNPDTVMKTSDDIATTLLGRRATAGEISVIGGILRSQEQAQRGAEFQSYLGQQEASAELFHGGIAQPKSYSLGDIQYALGGQTAITASTTPPGATPGAVVPGAAGYIDPSGNYIPPTNVTPHAPPGALPGGAITPGIGQPVPSPAPGTTVPAPAVNAPLVPAMGQQSMTGLAPSTPITTTSGVPGAPGVGDQGTVGTPQTLVLGDGTVLVLPQQFQATAAASPTDAAYAYFMQNNQPEVQGRTIAAAMQAVAQSIAAGRGVR